MFKNEVDGEFQDVGKDEREPVDAKDVVAAVIEKAVDEQCFNLSRPARNDEKLCLFVQRLVKKLIIHERWLRTIHEAGSNVDKTLPADFKQYVCNHTCKQALIDAIKGLECKGFADAQSN